MNKQVIEDEKVSPRDRMKVAELTCVYEGYIYRLIRDGPFEQLISDNKKIPNKMRT